MQQLYGCTPPGADQSQGSWWIAGRSELLAVVLAAAAIGCSAYDETLVEPERASKAATVRDAPDAGTASGPVPGDVCGDGRVALFEACDIAIPLGQPGACPQGCPPLVDCVPRRLEGGNCQARCVVLADRCEHGDGCCPAECDSDHDDDCSQRCGDGIVQRSEGETCEPGSEAAPCATLRDCDDGDACTADVLIGGGANCNAVCSHAEIRSFSSGDGCCPRGADANSDRDCMPECGNGVAERGEECDGGDYCDGACQLAVSPEQSACLDRLPESANECDRCSCIECAEARLACVASGDATRDLHCAAIIECANASDCTGAACYCGDRYCRTAGPCREVIDAAAAADPSRASVSAQSADPETAIGRSLLLGTCKGERCGSDCP